MNKRYFRNCPQCERELSYSNKKNRNTAEKKNICCSSCSHKNAHKRPEVMLKNKKRSERLSEKYKGSGNPFFGKKHSEETREKIVKDRDFSVYKTKDFKDKMSKVTSGKKNPMYRKNYYNIWVEKYGTEEADRKMKELSKIRSENSSGSNNPMYGKPTPHGAGNGWSGWYKGWFFRSLRELSYMVKEIEGKNKKWRTAETKDLRIKYVDYKGDERTYIADFLIEEKELIEVKPKKLKKSLIVRLKAKAARGFCEEKGLVYKITDVKILSEKEIKKLHDDKIIKFIKKYQEMYNDRYSN